MVATSLGTPVTRAGVGSALVAGAIGAALLLARPLLVDDVEHPTLVLVTMFVTIGLVGAWWPLDRTAAPLRAGAPPPTIVGAGISILVAGAGMAAFALVRVVAGGAPAAPALAGYVALNSLAAVAEEALFRRLVFGSLSPFGPAVAVAGSAAAFAVVHVTVWGAWVLPVDLAAGLILSWQRWATGRWSVPAVTHVFANLVAILP